MAQWQNQFDGELTTLYGVGRMATSYPRAPAAARIEGIRRMINYHTIYTTKTLVIAMLRHTRIKTRWFDNILCISVLILCMSDLIYAMLLNSVSIN